MANNNAQSSTADQTENARTGYQAAVNLWVYEGTTIWSKFSAMVYANTILLATLGLIITSQKAADLTILRVALSILGLCLCGSWFFLTKRSFEFYLYWIFSARELEEQHLSPVETISRGAMFAEKKEIAFKTDPQVFHKMNPTLPNPRIEWVSYFIIGVFSILYLLTLFQC